MIAPFQLHRPSSLEEALALLAHHGDDIRVLAGGSEIILLLKMGLVSTKHVVDIKTIAGLDSLVFDPDQQQLRIGSLVTHRKLETSEVVREHFPVLAKMARQVANVRVRNVGTLAGNLAFAEPHADPGTLLLAYGARIKAQSTRGERSIMLKEFFVDYYDTALDQDEIITEIEIPKPGATSSATYLRFCPGERPVVSMALVINWKNATCDDIQLVVGCVGPRPFRAEEAEEMLKNKSAQEITSIALDAGERVAVRCDPLADIWGSVEYKKQIIKTLVFRGLQETCGGEAVP
jgi:carbon-monoxide dehydrogenase medium subunit